MAQKNQATQFGTDEGPECPLCKQTLWVYFQEPSQSGDTCSGCEHSIDHQHRTHAALGGEVACTSFGCGCRGWHAVAERDITARCVTCHNEMWLIAPREQKNVQEVRALHARAVAA